MATKYADQDSDRDAEQQDRSLPALQLPDGWQEELRRAAEEQSRKESAGSAYLSTRGGVLSWQKTPLPGNKIVAVVLDSIFERSYYPGDFDPDSIEPPVCFALGSDESKLSHHENSEKPQNVGPCGLCAMAQWGSAPNGKGGQACKSRRRLPLMLATDLKGTPEQALGGETMGLKIPPTSTKAWGSYVAQLSTVVKRPPWGVLTEITLHPDPKVMFAMRFSFAGQLSDKEVAIALARRKAIGDSFMRPWEKHDAEKAAEQEKARAAEREASKGRRKKY